MALYLFSHPDTGEIKEIILSVNDEKVYIENGVKWNREYTVPQASIDTQINPNSATDFDQKFANKKVNIGDMWNASKELSKKREKSQGIDPIKTKALADYSKIRKGRKPPPGIDI